MYGTHTQTVVGGLLKDSERVGAPAWPQTLCSHCIIHRTKKKARWIVKALGLDCHFHVL